MYSETAKVGVEIEMCAESQMLLEVLTPCEKGSENKMPMCFGTRWLSENSSITAHFFHHVSFLYGQIQFYSLVEIT